MASAIAALCFKRSEENTAADAGPGPRDLGADRWSEGKVFDEPRNIDARLAALWPVVRRACGAGLPLCKRLRIRLRKRLRIRKRLCFYVFANVFAFKRQRLDQGEARGSFCLKCGSPSCRCGVCAAGGREGRRMPADRGNCADSLLASAIAVFKVLGRGAKVYAGGRTLLPIITLLCKRRFLRRGFRRRPIA